MRRHRLPAHHRQPTGVAVAPTRKTNRSCSWRDCGCVQNSPPAQVRGADASTAAARCCARLTHVAACCRRRCSMVAKANLRFGRYQTTVLRGHNAPITHLASLGDVVCTASKDGTARVWYVARRRGLVLPSHGGYLTTVLPMCLDITTPLLESALTAPGAARGFRSVGKAASGAALYLGDMIVTGSSGTSRVRTQLCTVTRRGLRACSSARVT